MALAPFTWGAGGQKLSPSQVKKYSDIAAALAARSGAPKSLGEGLNRVGEALVAKSYEGRSAAGEAEGAKSRGKVLEALMANPDPSMADLMGAMGNEWVTADPGSSAVVQALMGREMEQNDPAYQLGLEKLGLEVEALRSPVHEPDWQTHETEGGDVYRWDDALPGSSPELFFDAPEVAPEEPAAVQALRIRAEEAGLQPGTEEYRQFMINGGAANGMALSVGPDGSVSFTQGSGKLTEAQGKDIGFYTRGVEANDQLSMVEGALTDLVQQNSSLVPLGIGNYLRTPEFRQAKVAADNFLAAVLRKDSGAAITEQEFGLYGPMFLPIPGDDPGTLQQKRRMRDVAMMAIESGLGTADTLAQANRVALGLEPSITPRPESLQSPGATGAPPPQEMPAAPSQSFLSDPTIINHSSGFPPEVLWQNLTPEQRALWP